jgi:hypothetical protein
MPGSEIVGQALGLPKLTPGQSELGGFVATIIRRSIANCQVQIANLQWSFCNLQSINHHCSIDLAVAVRHRLPRVPSTFNHTGPVNLRPAAG